MRTSATASDTDPFAQLDVFAVQCHRGRTAGQYRANRMDAAHLGTHHSPAQAFEWLQWYARRLTIETRHQLLKSGCRIEARQFSTLDRFVRATSLSRLLPGVSSTLHCWHDWTKTCLVKWSSNPSNGKPFIAACIEPPGRRATVPSLHQAIRWIATLGGYLNRRHDPPPGATIIWRGFLVLHEITEMFRMIQVHNLWAMLSREREGLPCTCSNAVAQYPSAHLVLTGRRSDIHDFLQ